MRAARRSTLIAAAVVAVLGGSFTAVQAAPPAPAPQPLDETLTAGHGDAVLDASSITPSGATASAIPTVGTFRVAVVLMHLPGSRKEPVKKKLIQDTMFNAPDSVADWYEEVSGGQLSVSGQVFGWYDSNVPKNNCDTQLWLDTASAAAQADGYSEANFDDLVVYTPYQKVCIFGALAFVAQRGVVLNGATSTAVINHEIGHNLGLNHAASYNCSGAPFSTSCALNDYGDPYDEMGSSPNRHFSAAHKYQLGWIPASEVHTVASGTETIDLTASEHPVVAGATELIKIPLANGSSYAIERRESFGYDKNLMGVWVRVLERVGSTDTQLIDMTPLTPDPYPHDGNLDPGHKFVDAVNDVTIETLSDSGPTASVRVCVGGCDLSPAPTIVPPPGPLVLSVQGSTVHVVGTTGDDVVRLSRESGTRQHVDANGAPMTAGPGCTLQGPIATCKGTSFDVSLGEGNDVVTGAGKARAKLDGGPGNDTFIHGHPCRHHRGWFRLRHGRVSRTSPGRGHRDDRRRSRVGRAWRARQHCRRRRARAAALDMRSTVSVNTFEEARSVAGHRHLGWVGECLEHHAVPLRRGDERVELFGSGIRFEVEVQPDRAEADRRGAIDAERAAEVEITIGSHHARHIDAAVRRDRSQRDTRAGDERLEEHVSGTGEGAVAAGRRVQTGLDERSAGLYRTGDVAVCERAFGVQGDHRRRRLGAVALLEGTLPLA